MKTNFINRAEKTYLVANPDNFGNGQDLGYYRETLFGDFEAIQMGVIRSGAVETFPSGEFASFNTAEEAQSWLRKETGSDRP